MPGEILIRQARPEDAPAIARVHVDVWRTAYAGIMPKGLLAGLNCEERRAMWEKRLAAGSAERADFVAETEELEVVGFACGGSSRSPELPFDGELYGIYILQAYQGRGAGKKLTHKIMDWLMEAGCRSMFLWVLADGPARAFYESIGGRLLPNEKTEEFGGRRLSEVAYAWEDLGEASKALEARL